MTGGTEEVHLDAGVVFTLAPKIGLNSHLIEATWDGDSIILFADDLENKCERIATQKKSGPTERT